MGILSLAAARRIQKPFGIRSQDIVRTRTSLTKLRSALRKNQAATLEASRMEVLLRLAQVIAHIPLSQRAKFRLMSSWESARQVRDGRITTISAGLGVRSTFQTGMQDLAVSTFGTGSGTLTRTRTVLGRRMISSSSITPPCRGTETCLLQHVTS